jgi:hypothetical protein
MKLRRLLSPKPGFADAEVLPPGVRNRESDEWDLLTEIDRLRSENTGLAAEAQRQSSIGQDYARAAGEQRVRVEELSRETAIAHTNAQLLERRLVQAEERTVELDELVDALRLQRDRLQTYYEQQKDRADRAESAAAAMRDAASEVLAAHDRQAHAPLGTRSLIRAGVESADALDMLRRALRGDVGKDYLGPELASDIRRYFLSGDLPRNEEQQLKEAISRALSGERRLDPNVLDPGARALPAADDEPLL